MNSQSLADMIEAVLKLARKAAATPEEVEACDQLEDYVVNQLGDE